jgi:hypothetical protein
LTVVLALAALLAALPDGTRLGSVAMPRRFTPYRIGDDFVPGRHVDTLGVERVQLRTLRTR